LTHGKSHIESFSYWYRKWWHFTSLQRRNCGYFASSYRHIW